MTDDDEHSVEKRRNAVPTRLQCFRLWASTINFLGPPLIHYSTFVNKLDSSEWVSENSLKNICKLRDSTTLYNYELLNSRT
jgi:hypothetical protein